MPNLPCMYWLHPLLAPPQKMAMIYDTVTAHPGPEGGTTEEQDLLRSLGFVSPLRGWWRPEDAPFYVGPPSVQEGKWRVDDGGSKFVLGASRYRVDVATFEEVIAIYVAHKLRDASA